MACFFVYAAVKSFLLFQNEEDLLQYNWKFQIVAAFEEQDGQQCQHPGADGKSASSAGTSSPEIFYNQKDYVKTRKSEILGYQITADII